MTFYPSFKLLCGFKLNEYGRVIGFTNIIKYLFSIFWIYIYPNDKISDYLRNFFLCLSFLHIVDNKFFPVYFLYSYPHELKLGKRLNKYLSFFIEAIIDNIFST